MPIGKIEQFDLASKKWSAYIRRVQQFITLNEIKTELQVATLVTLVGEATYSLMCDLCAPADPETKTFVELVKIVSDHLEPKRSEIAERHIFRQRRQKDGENLSEYLQALKHLASTCNFASNLEENLRDQFVSGLANDDMRSRLFAEQALTYKKAVELALALEAAERHAHASGSGCAASAATAGAAAHEPLHRVDVRRPGAGGGDRGPGAAGGRDRAPGAGATGGKGGDRATGANTGRDCWRCGRAHRADWCRFRNYSCDECGQKGHLKAVCKKGNLVSSGKAAEKGMQARGHNYLGSEDESDCDIYNLNVCGKDDKPYLVKVCVNGVDLTFELDTGSKLSTINFDCYQQFFNKVPLQDNDICLRSYTGTVIKPIGFIIVNTILGEHKATNLKLFVIKNGGPPLLGRSWLRRLKIDNVAINDNLYHVSESNLIEKLRTKFPTVFAPGLGTCTKKMSLKLLDNNPVFIKARSLPLALRNPVERELERLVAEGTIYKVDYSDFGTPIVPVIKKSGEIRICGDYKVTVNPKLIREPYPLPRIEELFAALSGGEQYSKIDLTNAYQQLVLEDDSQACTAITTHIGTFVYRRTPFGLSCIPEKFQKFMEETLRGLQGVTVFLDDIAVTGRDRVEHVANLEALFIRLRDVGLRIKLEKCQFMQDSITYVGFIIDKQGLHPDPEKIKAMVQAPAPKDVTQLRSFLGLINYYAKFIPNLSSVLYPLHRLLRKNITWVWNNDCEEAFQKVKQVVSSEKVLVHYDPKLPLVLAVDSSSYGLGSVLSHRFPDGSERPICFASRSLTAPERAYSQLDKEALAIITGVVKHHQYVYGRHFIIKTDHKPLTFIFGPKYGLPQTAASRLQRYATKLAAYDFELEFVKSNDNYNVDALSRLPLPCRRTTEKDPVSYINYVEESFPISAREVASATQKDDVLKNIYTYINEGWPANQIAEPEKPYVHRKDHLFTEGGCIIYNHRVVIPDQLRPQVLRELHEGHLGVVKMKNLARGYVYWPQLDAEIEALCRACAACRQQRDAPPRAQLHPWAFPARPWQRLHVDFAEFQGKHYLVTVDAHSKWLEVQKMAGTSASATVSKLRELFARFGLPTQVVSDGGPPFGAAEFADYMRKNLITHTITSPYRPAGNGAAENAVKSVKRAMKKAVHEGADVDTAVAKFLFQYRNCEHCTTGVAPAEALLGRRLRGRLDAIMPGAAAAERVQAAQERAGVARPGAERHMQPGDAVLARDYRARTGKWVEATVAARDAPLTYRVRLSDGREWKRHVDQLLPLKRSGTRLSLSRVATGEDDKIKTAETLMASRQSNDGDQEGNESDEYHDLPGSPPSGPTTPKAILEPSEPADLQTTDSDNIDLNKKPRTRPVRACIFKGKYKY